MVGYIVLMFTLVPWMRGAIAAGRERDGVMAAATEAPERVQLEIEGMTCASCATRIERKLNRLDGVEAAVNFATEQASVSYDPGQAAVEDADQAVEAAGYRAGSPRRAATRRRRSDAAPAADSSSLPP